MENNLKLFLNKIYTLPYYPDILSLFLLSCFGQLYCYCCSDERCCPGASCISIRLLFSKPRNICIYTSLKQFCYIWFRRKIIIYLIWPLIFSNLLLIIDCLTGLTLSHRLIPTGDRVFNLWLVKDPITRGYPTMTLSMRDLGFDNHVLSILKHIFNLKCSTLDIRVYKETGLLLLFLELYLYHCVKCCISCNILYVSRETNKLKLKRQCL